MRRFESLKSLIYIYVRPTPYFFGGGRWRSGRTQNTPGPPGGSEKIFLLPRPLLFSSFQSGARRGAGRGCSRRHNMQSIERITMHSVIASIDYFNRILVRIITVIGTSIKTIPSIPGSRPAAGAALLYFLVYFLYLLHNLYQVQITDLYLLILYNSS